MKRISFFIVAVIFLAIAAKASLTLPVHQIEYAALSTDTKKEQVDQFFRYKVNNLQSTESRQLSRCTVKSSVCCNV